MKKIVLLFFVTTFVASQISAQKSEIDPSLSQSGGSGNRRSFKTELPSSDKAESFEVKSISGVTFAVSNIADGSVNSYNHFLRITLNLVMSDPKVGNFQLVFYSDKEAIPYSVYRLDGTVSIFYPASLYADIKEKLESAFTSRKKVTIKVTEKTTGFREGILSF